MRKIVKILGEHGGGVHGYVVNRSLIESKDAEGVTIYLKVPPHRIIPGHNLVDLRFNAQAAVSMAAAGRINAMLSGIGKSSLRGIDNSRVNLDTDYPGSDTYRPYGITITLNNVDLARLRTALDKGKIRQYNTLRKLSTTASSDIKNTSKSTAAVPRRRIIDRLLRRK